MSAQKGAIQKWCPSHKGMFYSLIRQSYHGIVVGHGCTYEVVEDMPGQLTNKRKKNRKKETKIDWNLRACMHPRMHACMRGKGPRQFVHKVAKLTIWHHWLIQSKVCRPVVVSHCLSDHQWPRPVKRHCLRMTGIQHDIDTIGFLYRVKFLHVLEMFLFNCMVVRGRYYNLHLESGTISFFLKGDM